jgi:hypothetical protein
MNYFSYGSNMSIRRLCVRVPSALRLGVGVLRSHELKFHKVSTHDGSAKCDALATGKPDQLVYGVVYRIPEDEKPHLDQAEGLGFGYEQKDVLIEMLDAAAVRAFCYCATAIDPGLKPFDWYKEHVLIGARENNLPEVYLLGIESIEAVWDSDTTRRERELSIYRQIPDQPSVSSSIRKPR